MEQTSMLDQLQALDERVLSEVVRQDQGCPDFVLTSWQVERLSDKGVSNPYGLFRFKGLGYDPAQKEDAHAWSVVLKILQAPEEEGEITNVWYWKRELLAIQSGLLEDLPVGGVKAPRFYGTVEQDSGAWIWMEFVQENDPPRWPLQNFPAAARLLGRLNGAYLSTRSLPDYPWLSRDQGISWAKEADPDMFLDHPNIQGLFSTENRLRLHQVWGERERFFDVYHSLPQVFCHCDAFRRNQLFRINGKGGEELVSIDWAQCGIAPVGYDLSQLVVNSALMFEMEIEDLKGVEEASFPAYLEGLQSTGWQGDQRLVRLGYCVSATLFPLMPSPRVSVTWSGEGMQDFALQIFGRRFEEIVVSHRILMEHILDLSEEALTLMDNLGLGSEKS